MPYVKNWLHCVWGTKSKKPFLKKEIRLKVISHIKENAISKGIFIDVINGYTDHLHCLINLHPDQPLSNVIRLLKGESSFWINRNHITQFRFSWAVEYFAVSISESHINRVRDYIRNQEKHHQQKTWEKEYNDYIIKYGFERIIC